MRSSAAAAEWRAYWPLPFAAAAGAATAAVHTYSLGVFMRPLQAAFGWGRADISLGLSIAVIISAIFSVSSACWSTASVRGSSASSA